MENDERYGEMTRRKYLHDVSFYISLLLSSLVIHPIILRASLRRECLSEYHRIEVSAGCISGSLLLIVGEKTDASDEGFNWVEIQ